MKHPCKKSIMGPPHTMHITVPILIYVLSTKISIKMMISDIAICVLPWVMITAGIIAERFLKMPCTKTLNGSAPRSDKRNKVKPR